jgi:hypothetical protein
MFSCTLFSNYIAKITVFGISEFNSFVEFLPLVAIL